MIRRLISASFTSIKNLEQVKINESDVGKRLDQYLKKMGVGYSIIHKLLRNKCFYVKDMNETILKHPQYKLRMGDTLYYHKNFEIKEKIEIQKEVEDKQLIIPREQAKRIIQKMLLFENQNIIVLNKEGGYSTQGDQEPQINIFTILKSYFKNPNIHIVHRIDKASTGVVMFAKNQKSAKIIQDSINNRLGIHKFYLALSAGVPFQKKGLIDCNIEWSDSKNKAKLSLHSNKNSKQCLTYYKSINQINNQTTYLVKLISGRKHQIRCHLSKYLQTPILNDHHYQGPCIDKSPDSIYLHSYITIFQHPDVINKVFQNQQTQSKNGKVKIIDKRLWIQGKINWQKNPPSQIQLHTEIQSLIDYSPQIKLTKIISY